MFFIQRGKMADADGQRSIAVTEKPMAGSKA